MLLPNIKLYRTLARTAVMGLISSAAGHCPLVFFASDMSVVFPDVKSNIIASIAGVDVMLQTALGICADARRKDIRTIPRHER
jgi:hypothetical protein